MKCLHSEPLKLPGVFVGIQVPCQVGPPPPRVQLKIRLGPVQVCAQPIGLNVVVFLVQSAEHFGKIGRDDLKK